VTEKLEAKTEVSSDLITDAPPAKAAEAA